MSEEMIKPEVVKKLKAKLKNPESLKFNRCPCCDHEWTTIKDDNPQPIELAVCDRKKDHNFHHSFYLEAIGEFVCNIPDRVHKYKVMCSEDKPVKDCPHRKIKRLYEVKDDKRR